jgi:type IV fimbrial biogenesis protein FimT
MKALPRGFTLIELIVGLALVLILLTLAVPSFKDLIQSNRLMTAVDDLLSALQLARSEAIKRGIRITLCKSADGASCAVNGGYDQGWVVFADSNNNAAIDSGELIIRRFQAVSTNGAMTINGNTPVAHYISYLPSGAPTLTTGAFQAGTLTICAMPKAYRIIINRVGRIRTEPVAC